MQTSETPAAADALTSGRGTIARAIRNTAEACGQYRIQIVTILLSALAAWLVLNWVHTAQEMARYYVPIPVWDYWRVPMDVYSGNAMAALQRQHNDHRIVFPEIVFMADMLLFHGRIVLPMVVSFLCYAATWAVLSWSVWTDRTIALTLRAIAAMLAGVVIGWKECAVVVGDPFLLQWTLSTLCAVLSLALLSRAGRGSGNRPLAGAIASGFVATFSSGNCLLLWPLLLGVAVVRRFTRRQFLALLAAAIVTLGIYFVKYEFGHLRLLALLMHPFYTVEFVASYIAMPFGDIKSPQFAARLGMGSMALVAALLVLAIRKRVIASSPGVVLFGTYIFVLLTAALTAAGRMNPTDPVFGSAKAVRYWVIPFVHWGTVVLLCTWMASKCSSRILLPMVTNFVFAALFLIGASKLRVLVKQNAEEFAARQLATLAMENNIEDPALARKLFPAPSVVFSFLPKLRAHHVSIYSFPRVDWLGKPSSALGLIDHGWHTGGISYEFPVVSGIEVVGWAEPERNGSERILFIDERQRIVGTGQRLRAGLPWLLRSSSTPELEAWVGFVNLSNSEGVVMPYFLSRGHLTRIPGAISPSPLKHVPSESATLLSGINWHMDKSWTPNGIPKGGDFGLAPRGSLYASWSGDDANTGRIETSDFAAPADGCLILPVLHGPSVDGLSAKIEDVGSGEMIADIPLQGGDLVWNYWRVTLDKSATRLRIIANDEGSGWGQWIAIAQPSTCDVQTQ